MILRDLCSLALVSVHLKKQLPFPVFTDWFQQGKTFSCWLPGLVGLPRQSLFIWGEARSCGYCWIFGALGWQGCCQQVGQAWLLSGSWAEQTVSRSLVSRASAGKRVCSGSAFDGLVTRYADGCG